jgi:hypothetical protein
MYIIILIPTIQFSRDNMHPKKIYPEMLDDAKDAKATFHIATVNIGITPAEVRLVLKGPAAVLASLL